MGEQWKRAYKAKPKEMEKLVDRMQDNYKAMDSYGYETVEGIVAGVGSWRTTIFTSMPACRPSEGPEDVAPVVLDLGNGKKIVKEGALFTFIIEPALWGGDKRWVVAVGDGKTMPRPEVLVAAAKDVNKKIGELVADANAWNASVSDCFGAMVVMTPDALGLLRRLEGIPLLEDKSGRFQAVSRVPTCAASWAAAR